MPIVKPVVVVVVVVVIVVVRKNELKNVEYIETKNRPIDPDCPVVPCE